MMQNGEKPYKRLPTSSSSSSLSALGSSVENSLSSKLTFFAILASFFLFLLLHQSFISRSSSSSSSSSSNLLLHPTSRSSNHFASPSSHSNNTTTYADKTADDTTTPSNESTQFDDDQYSPAEEQINSPSDFNTTDDFNKTAHLNTTTISAYLNNTTDELHPADMQIKPSDFNSSTTPSNKTTNTTLVHTNETADSSTATSSPRPPKKPIDEEEVRTFKPYGSAAALFVLYSAYRGGNNTFAVIGLGSKPLYVYGKPTFECYWLPSSSAAQHTNQSKIKSKLALVMQPDFGFGRVYTVVILNCTFEEPVGTAPDQRGGQLVLHAFYGDGLGKAPERIVALEEDKESYNASAFQPPFPYEYVYCGSPLFSNLDSQRMREWMAYHVMKFGPRSHFIFHDAGGMHGGVRAVLEPWKKQGFVTIQNVKQTTQYDGYYYNQFLIVNDCLHRTKFMANWTFFFDVDEYIYNPPDVSLRSILDWHANHTSLSFQQLRMSDSLCQFPEPENDTRWAFEKLVYGEAHQDLKYAVQARGIFATGVHYSQKELGHMDGERGWAWWPHMRFYHYHNTISKHGKLCKRITLSNSTSYTYHKRKFKLDTSMVSLGPLVQAFERQHIGTP